MLAAAHGYQQLTDHHRRMPPLVAEDSRQVHPAWDQNNRSVPDEAPVVTTTLDSTW